MVKIIFSLFSQFAFKMVSFGDEGVGGGGCTPI